MPCQKKYHLCALIYVAISSYFPTAAVARDVPTAAASYSVRHALVEILTNYPSLREAASNLEASSYAEQGALWQFFPKPSFVSQNISASATNPLYGYGFGDPRVSTISIYQPLWTGGRIYSNLKKSKAGVKADEANFRLVSQAVALSFIQAYGDWLGAQSKARALRRSHATHERLIALITRRIERGISASSDLVLAEGRINAVSSALDQANAQANAALNRLEQLYGRPLDAKQLLAMNTALDMSTSDQVAMVDRALVIAPEIKKASSDIAAAEAEIGVQRSSYSPEVFVQASRQYGNFGVAGQAPQNTVGVGLATQFGAGLSNFSQVDQAKSRFEAAKSKEQTVKRQITEQVKTDISNYQFAELRLASLQKAFAASEQVTLAWDRQFFAGRKSWLELMNATAELAQSEVSVAETKATLFILKWRLAIMTQGLETILAPEQFKG